MKKLLPKTSKNPQGFTLIELLIVITIMAILAVIAIAIYSGVQARARNAKRRAEVHALATALEVNKTPTSLIYTQIKSEYFPGGVIPNNITGDVPHYAFIYMTAPGYTMAAPTPAQWLPTSAVPTGVTVTPPAGPAPVIIDINNTAGPFPAGAPPNIYSFMMCALLEPEVVGTTTRLAHCLPSAQ